MRPESYPTVRVDLSPDELAVLIGYLSRYEPPAEIDRQSSVWHAALTDAAARLTAAYHGLVR